MDESLCGQTLSFLLGEARRMELLGLHKSIYFAWEDTVKVLPGLYQHTILETMYVDSGGSTPLSVSCTVNVFKSFYSANSDVSMWFISWWLTELSNCYCHFGHSCLSLWNACKPEACFYLHTRLWKFLVQTDARALSSTCVTVILPSFQITISFSQWCVLRNRTFTF